jgi:hypothetical protein
VPSLTCPAGLIIAGCHGSPAVAVAVLMIEGAVGADPVIQIRSNR